MPKPPSKHGLERKYKSWRKGKSKTAKSKGSLKQQLRGKQRLLQKTTDEARQEELQQEIQALQHEIQEKQVLTKTRQNAKDSHGVRFLERQRLVRLERSTRKLLAESKSQADKRRYQDELKRIALDQVYVAHFPHDVRYLPLFRNGVRVVDVNSRKLARRATTRKRIILNLSTTERCKWISSDQYKLLPQTWSVELEKKTFGGSTTKGNDDNVIGEETNDNRFAVSQQHEALVKAAEQAESALLRQDEESEDDASLSSDGSDSSSSSDNDEANPLVPQNKNHASKHADSNDNDSASSDSDSSSDDEDETSRPEMNTNKASDDSSDDGTSSDSDSSSDDDDEATPTSQKRPRPEVEVNEDDFDDFLMPATENVNAFEKAKQDAPQYVSGDKSKGWATQRQRPGQFKKRRVRS